MNGWSKYVNKGDKDLRKKYEILTSENGFSVRDKDSGEIVHKYDRDVALDTLVDIKTKLNRIINN